MKLFKEARAKTFIARGMRLSERRQTAVGSFAPFSRDIYRDVLLTPHAEMEECVRAYNMNSFFQSGINTMTDFIMGGGVVIKGEDPISVKRCEAYLEGLKTETWLREVVENTIKTGNGYCEIDYNPNTGVPVKVYPISDDFQGIETKTLLVRVTQKPSKLADLTICMCSL